MRSYSRLVSSAFLLTAVVFAGAGCRGGGDRPVPRPATDPTAIFGSPDGAPITEPVPPEGMSCSHEYYPLRTGYHIQYKTTYPPAMGTSGSGRYALRVMRVTSGSVYIKTAFERSGGGAPIQADMEYRCIGGGLYAAGYMNMGGVSPGGPAGNYEVRTTRAEGELLPAHISVGSVWESSFSITITPPDGSDSLGSAARPVSMGIGIKRRAVALERVRVPAGEYEAMKIVNTTSFDGRQAMTGTEWWVKDVGMVKATMSAGLTPEENIITEATGVTVPR